MSGLSRETEPIGNFFKEIYYEGLAHKIMEAEKSHHLLSASWRARKASGVIQSKGLRIKGADGINPSPRAGEDEMKCPSSNSDAEKRGKFLLPVVLLRPSTDWMVPTHTGESNLL